MTTALQEEKFAPGTYGERMQEIEHLFWPEAEANGVPYPLFKRRLFTYVQKWERNVEYQRRQLYEEMERHERLMKVLEQNIADADQVRRDKEIAMVKPL